MSYRVKTAVEKEIDQEVIVDGKTYPPPPVEQIGTLPKSKNKKRGSLPESETDGGAEPQVKTRVLLQSKGEGWKLKLPKHHKYRVIFIQEKADNPRVCYELFAANEYSITKDAFNSANKTLCPLLEDGRFALSKDLLKHILLPEPLAPECIGPQLLKVMEKEPGHHPDWQQLIQKLTAPKNAEPTAESNESGLSSLKRKLQKQLSIPVPPPTNRQNSLTTLQPDLGAMTHLIAVPKVASKVSDEEASEEVWTLFKRGTLRAKHDSNKIWLIEATEKQYVKSCAKLILSRVVDVNEKHPLTGDTALHIAVRSGNHTLVKLFLAYQADVTILNKKKESPYDAAQKLKGANASAIMGSLEDMKKLRIQTALYYSQNSKLPKKRGSSDTFLLSLDGGGMRSVIMCHILTAIENRMKELNSSCKPLQSYFDYIAGTSAGAIIGGLLLYADVSVPLSGMYLYNFMVDVFCSQKSERIKKLKGFIADTVGAETVMSEAKDGHLIVTTTLASISPNKLHLMTSYGEPRDEQLGPDKRKVWEALVASAAAPTFFPSFGSFLDGGLMANNPTLPAMTDIIRQGRKKSKVAFVLSLGTGYVDPPQRVDNFEVYVPGFSKDIVKNLYQSSMGLVSLLSHFVEQTTQSNGEVVREAETWCESIGASYFRLSPPLKEEVAPDIKSIEKFVSLVYETEIYILQQCTVIDSIAKILMGK